MSLTKLHKAFDLIEELGGDFDGEKSASLISKAEKALGFGFPPTYKEFLLTLGCGDVEGLEFYGLINENFEESSVPDAIWLTLDERKSGLPSNLMLVSSTGDGNYIALKMDETNGENENPVVLISPTGDIIEKVADDFGTFLLNELEAVL